jgi:hypothetical protein
MARCPRASSSVRHTEKEDAVKEHLTVSALSARLRRVADDGSRWRGPARNHGSHAVVKNGSAASELAADAYHCIMVWAFGPPHTRMWHEASCTHPQLPSDFVIPTTASVPSCSNPSRTRPLPVALRAILDGFCARRLNSIAWVGTRKRLLQVEQGNSEVQENG